MSSQTLTIALDQLLVDTALQPRVGGLDDDHVRELEEAAESWPPVVEVQRDGHYVLVDGFHRLAAAQNLELASIQAAVTEAPADGDLHALAFALNAAHGRPLSLVDRRAFAERLLRRYPELADREIGRRSGLSSNTVGALRTELETAAQIEQTPVRVGAGGYQYTVGTNERQRRPGELPGPDFVEKVGDLVTRVVSPADRIEQRKIAHYLQRLSVALEELDAFEGWENSADAADALVLVYGEPRANELAQTLGYHSREVLNVAINLGYEDEWDVEYRAPEQDEEEGS